MRYLVHLVLLLLLTAPALADSGESIGGVELPVEAGALFEPDERLDCRDLHELAFHEELTAQHTDPLDYDASLQANWLGVPYAVGPPLRIPGQGVSQIRVTPIKTWSPASGRVVLPVKQESFPETTQLDAGVMVTFEFHPLDEEAVRVSLEDLMQRDPEPRIGPDLVVMIDGVPLAGASLHPMLPLHNIAVAVLDRSAWEVATYLSAVLDCRREGS